MGTRYVVAIIRSTHIVLLFAVESVRKRRKVLLTDRLFAKLLEVEAGSWIRVKTSTHRATSL